MNYLFRDCESLAKLDLSSFNTSNVDTLSDPFGGRSGLTRIKLGKGFAFTDDIWDRDCCFPDLDENAHSGMWLSSADGQQYATDEIPSNVAAMYTAQLYTAPEKVQRIGGQDSASTAAQIAETAFSNGSKWVVIARDDHFADAMSATGLAGTLDAPIVLTSPHYNSAATADAIMKLGPTHA